MVTPLLLPLLALGNAALLTNATVSIARWFSVLPCLVLALMAAPLLSPLPALESAAPRGTVLLLVLGYAPQLEDVVLGAADLSNVGATAHAAMPLVSH